MESKYCSRCNRVKNIEDFNWAKKSLKLKQNYCKICTRKAHNKSYTKHRIKMIKKVTQRTRRIMPYKRKQLFEYLKTHPCVDCGETDILVLQFDHVRGKKYGIVAMLHTGHSWKDILKEINKCEIRCCNCHFRRHHKNDWRVKFLEEEKHTRL